MSNSVLIESYAAEMRNSSSHMRIPMKGPCNRQTGYGNHFIDLVLGLLKEGAAISMYPYYMEPPLPPELLATMVDPYPHDAPVGIVMANPMNLERIADYTIGVTTWETTRIPRREFKQPLELIVDELIVPCQQNIELFADLVPDLKVHYIPEAIDLEFWQYHERDYTTKPLKIGMFGCLTYRKGIDIAVEAFLECFENDPSVELHIGTTFYELPQFHYLPEVYSNIFVHNFGWSTRETVREFYHSLHALFSPFRGEGFYLPGAEFMATGGNFIAPNQMGASAYHDEAAGWVIPAQLDTVKHWGDYHGADAAGYGQWLSYDPEDVKATLLRFVESPSSLKAIKGERGSDIINHVCDPARQAKKVLEVYLNSYARVKSAG